MNKLLILFTLLSLLPFAACSQNTVTGTFSSHAHQLVKLVGFDGLNTYTIDSVKANSVGGFKLSYSPEDYGMAILSADQNQSMIVVLAANENLKMQGQSLAELPTITVSSGKQNKLFGQYANEQPRREQALSAWEYLAGLYKNDPLFKSQSDSKKAIELEMKRIHVEDSTFVAELNPQLYVAWFLPLRKLVSSVQTIAQYRPAELETTIAAFRKIDYSDQRLYKSGLLRETLEAHVWLIENSGRPLDSVYVELNKSIDSMLATLIADEKRFNEVTEYLFKLLENRSLFVASEYLALKILTEQACTVDASLAAQLESYRAMKKGNTAPDFSFAPDAKAPGYASGTKPVKLSDIGNQYVLVVFGASWCPACVEELSAIRNHYPKWKRAGVEIVFVSLDTDKQAFSSFINDFPFISTCDYKKWDSQVVKAYHVFATPTMYLLNRQREIVLRPVSSQHLETWLQQHKNEKINE